MTDDLPPIRPGSDPSDVIRAWKDLVLHLDADGLVVEASPERPGFLLAEPVRDRPCWESLPLGAQSMDEVLRLHPPGAAHEVAAPNGEVFTLRVLPLGARLAPGGGYVLIATDNQPLESLYDTMEERLEDNITAWSDSIVLFNAMFDTANDATFLLTPEGSVVAANQAAVDQHATEGVRLAGRSVSELVGKRFRTQFERTMGLLPDAGVWTETITALDGEGESFPVEASLRRIRFSSYVLFQLVLRDLSRERELTQNLKEKSKKVEQLDVALQQVIRTVEKDRQQLRSQVMDEIKKQLLPALERIARESAPEVREGYRSLIEDRLVGLAGDGHEDRGLDDAELLRLSPREMEVCQLIQLGRSGKEIAELLNLSFETVQTHRKNIRRKLGLKGDSTTLARYLRTKASLT